MNWVIILIEAAAFALLFTVGVFAAGGKKDSPANIHNCPGSLYSYCMSAGIFM